MNSLRTQLQDGGIIAPGAHDPLTAILARRAGFHSVYVSGFAFEATQLGAPDMGVASMTELAQHVARITTATPELNVIVDVDTGFGGPNSIHRTVREFERAGAAAIQIEDQADPKRCPFLGGRKVVDRESAVARVKLAVESRTSEEMLIIARSDSDELSINEVIERCKRFADAGADLVLPMIRNVDGLPLAGIDPSERMDLYARLVEEIDHPLVTLDPPPGHTARDLFDVGVSVVTLPLISLQAAANATIDYFGSLLETGSSDAYVAANPPELAANLDMMKVLGVDDYIDREQRMTGN